MTAAADVLRKPRSQISENEVVEDMLRNCQLISVMR